MVKPSGAIGAAEHDMGRWVQARPQAPIAPEGVTLTPPLEPPVTRTDTIT